MPSLSLSDVVHLRSIESLASGKRTFLFTRMEADEAGAQYHAPIVLEDYLAYLDEDTNGRAPKAYSGPLDLLEGECSSYEKELRASHHFSSLVVGVRFHTNCRCFTLMCCGDSQTSGLGTLSGSTNYGILAAAQVSDADERLSFIAQATPGQSVANTIAAAERMLELATPDIITCVIDSPNDYTGRLVDSDHHRSQVESIVLGFIARAALRGISPILLTPIPFAAYDDVTTYGIQRARSGHIARMMSHEGLSVVDAQVILSDGDIFGRARPQFLSSDEAHLNNLGHETLKDALLPLLHLALAKL